MFCNQGVYSITWAVYVLYINQPPRSPNSSLLQMFIQDWLQCWGGGRNMVALFKFWIKWEHSMPVHLYTCTALFQYWTSVRQDLPPHPPWCIHPPLMNVWRKLIISQDQRTRDWLSSTLRMEYPHHVLSLHLNGFVSNPVSQGELCWEEYSVTVFHSRAFLLLHRYASNSCYLRDHV